MLFELNKKPFKILSVWNFTGICIQESVLETSVVNQNSCTIFIFNIAASSKKETQKFLHF